MDLGDLFLEIVMELLAGLLWLSWAYGRPGDTPAF